VQKNSTSQKITICRSYTQTEFPVQILLLPNTHVLSTKLYSKSLCAAIFGINHNNAAH